MSLAYNLWDEMARLQARVLAGTVLAGTANGGGISSPTDGGSGAGGSTGGGGIIVEVADKVMIEGRLHDVIVINGQRYAIDPANPNEAPAYSLGPGADGGERATLDATFHDRIRFGSVNSGGADSGTGGIDGGAGDGGSGGGAGDGGSSGGTDDGGATVQQTNVVLKMVDGSYLTATMTLGSTGSDFLHQAGFVYGGAGNDSIVGYAGTDIIDGGNGNDWMDGGAGSDVMDGRFGWDVLSYQSATSGVVVDLTGNANGGAAAGDVVSDIEVVQGSNFADTLVSIDRGGGNGAQLYGEGGHDTLLGKSGGDYLFGGAGDDLLDSGFGGDVLNGGAGADTFRFSSSLGAGNIDTVQDFWVTQGDRIVLSRNVFAAAGYDYLASSAFALGAAATTAAHRIVYNQSTGELFYDADGAGGVAAIKFAVIATHVQLSAASFQIL
jgi:Ca2+-binding RTX toxin-like protein